MKSFFATSKVEAVLEVIAQGLVAVPDRWLRGDHDLAPTIKYETLANSRPSLSAIHANERIKELISGESAMMVARFGSTELRATYRSVLRKTRTGPEKLYALVARLEPPFWTKGQYRNLMTQSGFFPITRNGIDRFVNLMLDSSSEVDLLGSWVPGENVLAEELAHVEVAELESLEPFHVPNPWSAELAGLKVLVIHPFSDTIERQFAKSRHRLFPGTDILPDFDLGVMAAVQSLDSRDLQFRDWFEALDYMTEEALSRDFDVAILGCGAYGFPLAARLKQFGKKAIHLGGVTQLLFGIKGKRWDARDAYRSMYNSSWTRPSGSETPRTAGRVDGGIYW